VPGSQRKTAGESQRKMAVCSVHSSPSEQFAEVCSVLIDSSSLREREKSNSPREGANEFEGGNENFGG